jgi:hypothetical protein
MDIEKLDLEIRNIDNPHNYIINLLNNNINDDELSNILRIFFKYHPSIAYDNKFRELFEDKMIIYINSWNILCKFYVLMQEKISLLVVLNNWHNIYNNEEFWALSLQDQIQFLVNKKEYFLSIYDCSHGGIPFHYKLSGIFIDNKYDKNEVFENVKYRLELILKLFGTKIFNYTSIPLITVSNFYNSTNDFIISYLTEIFNKMNELLDNTIYILNLYNTNTKSIENLINPVIVNICTTQIDSDSDVDIFFN